MERHQPDGTSVFTILLPEYLPVHWWEHLLHTQMALLKGPYLFRPHTAMRRMPYSLLDQSGTGSSGATEKRNRTD